MGSARVAKRLRISSGSEESYREERDLNDSTSSEVRAVGKLGVLRSRVNTPIPSQCPTTASQDEDEKNCSVASSRNSIHSRNVSCMEEQGVLDNVFIAIHRSVSDLESLESKAEKLGATLVDISDPRLTHVMFTVCIMHCDCDYCIKSEIRCIVIVI